MVVGAGWLGTALAGALGTAPVPRRHFNAGSIAAGDRVVVASGRARIDQSKGLAGPLRDELAHLRNVLDAAERAGSTRVVVLGSSDVAGMAPVVDSAARQDPRTVYAQVKAALEDECLLRHAAGLPLTCVRLAPVHGPGKARTQLLVRMSRMPVVGLPNGGRHSTGFILLADAVEAVRWLLDHPAPALQSVGAGCTPLVDLLGEMARAEGRALHSIPVPLPAGTVARALGTRSRDRIEWLLRLASPRLVPMEPPLSPTPLPEAARMLVQAI